jgi:NADH:ubiquinone oxidoreductase subunit 5 (chain L)/Multisubunit Na+/H+ antiporter, MnhA subunit
MTAFYMFRLLWLTFLGRSRMSPEVEHHVHESPWSMTGVLVVLAVLSALGGFIAVPHFLEPQLALPATDESLHAFETPLLVVSVALALAGLAAAAFLFGGPPERAERLRARFAGVHRVLAGKYFIDELYERVIGRPLVWVSDRIFLRLGDRALLDGTERHGGDGARHRAPPRAHPDRKPSSLRVARAGRHRRRADLELAPCLTRAS